MFEKARCLASILLIMVWFFSGCTLQQAVPDNQKGDKTLERAATGVFRHKWWNYFERALSHAEGRRFDEAVSDLNAALGQRDRDQRMARTYGMHFIDYFPHRELGIIYFETGDFEAARVSLERSLEEYPSAKARFYLDRVRRQLIRESGEIIHPPQLAFSFKDDVIWSREDPLVVEGIARDRHYVMAVNVAGKPVFAAGAQKEFPFRSALSLPQGTHGVTVQAVNLAGKTTSRTVTVHIDRQGPLIALSDIRPDGENDDAVFRVDGMLWDPAGVATADINADPLPLRSGQQQYRFSYRTGPGTPTLRIRASDRLGNNTVAEINLLEMAAAIRPHVLLAASEMSSLAGILSPRDRVAPEIEMKDWQASQVVYMDKIFLEGKIRDNGSVADFAINGKSLHPPKGRLVFFNQVVPLEAGTNTFLVEAQDSAGNRTVSTFEVIRRIPQAFQLEERLKVSVFPFDRGDSPSAHGSIFQDYLISALVEQQRFRIVERNLLESILQELQLSRAGIVDRKTALKVGQLVAAQSIIAGSIVETRNGIEIVSRMIDTETSEILATEDVYADLKGGAALSTLAQGLAIKYHHDFPLVEGIVISADGNVILTDIGSEKIKLRQRVIVYREAQVRHPVSQRILGTDKQILCRARITQVQKEMSKARLVEEPPVTVEPLQKVIAE